MENHSKYILKVRDVSVYTNLEVILKSRTTNEEACKEVTRMIERTVIAALVMGFAGFFFFLILLRSGWSESSARNALLLLMVLFENVHIMDCRSETKSAFSMSIFHSPILICGVMGAFLIHVLSMYLPLGQKILHTEPVDFSTWMLAFGCSLSILVVMEIHKLFWKYRYPQNLK